MDVDVPLMKAGDAGVEPLHEAGPLGLAAVDWAAFEDQLRGKLGRRVDGDRGQSVDHAVNELVVDLSVLRNQQYSSTIDVKKSWRKIFFKR